jgi:hypothetical protein
MGLLYVLLLWLLLLLLLLLLSLVTGLLFLVLPLNHRWPTPLRLQVSHCNTFRITCCVPSKVVFCSESIECFPGIASRFFLKLFVTIPLAPIITGIIVHFKFHIRCTRCTRCTHCISIPKFLYFNFFSASFCTKFLSAGIATSISVLVFSLFFFNYYIWPICCNLSVCVYCCIILLLLLLLLLLLFYHFSGYLQFTHLKQTTFLLQLFSG